MKYSTRILHVGAAKDPYTGALSIPIYPASTYGVKNIDERPEFDYSRGGNPTRKALEDNLAALETADGAFAFSSGVAAITSAITSVLNSGDHLIATKDIYGGSYRLLTTYLNRMGITHTFADTTDINEVKRALRPETKALFLESPSNPLLKIIDFESMVNFARKHDLITMVDNTFLTPYFFRPLEIGINMSIHSGTKFLGGHSDLIAGAVMTRTEEFSRAVKNVQNTTGNMLSPENSWLLMRGIKTLRARMTLQSEAAAVIARRLKEESWVTKVYYPGLEEHSGHDIIKREASGFGAVVSFTTDTVERAHKIMNSVRYWTVAVSLGGVESIMSYPARMSHAAIPAPEREKLGITDNLIRLSVGLEDVDDIMEDIIHNA